MRFARECIPFVLPPAAAAVVFAALGRPVWTVLAVLTALAVLLFFRVPTRRFAGPEDAVLAPANGRVLSITTHEEGLLPELGPCHKVVTFLSVFNVHVQRAPCAGKVTTSDYRPGRKVAAFRPEVGEVNERHTTVIETTDGDRIGVIQLAGLLARRVVGYTRPGDSLERGQLMGVIKFGSRVDLLVPAHYDLRVGVGDRLVEGLSVVAVSGEEEVS